MFWNGKNIFFCFSQKLANNYRQFSYLPYVLVRFMKFILLLIVTTQINYRITCKNGKYSRLAKSRFPTIFPLHSAPQLSTIFFPKVTNHHSLYRATRLSFSGKKNVTHFCFHLSLTHGS